jgi:hypothetical protein
MAKKKLPKAQPGREIEDTISSPAYDQIKINRQKQRMWDSIQGVPTTPREYFPKIKRPSKGDTVPTDTTRRPMINLDTLEIVPGSAKIGGVITSMDQVDKMYKAKYKKK